MFCKRVLQSDTINWWCTEGNIVASPECVNGPLIHFLYATKSLAFETSFFVKPVKNLKCYEAEVLALNVKWLRHHKKMLCAANFQEFMRKVCDFQDEHHLITDNRG